MILNPRWNPINKFCVVRLHYSSDPEKNTPEWKEQAHRGVSDRSWNREYEIDYDTFEGKPVFEGFREDLHVGSFSYEPLPTKTLYRGWDFGYHRPAVCIGWLNPDDQYIVKREIMGHDEGIKDFGKRVLNISDTEFPNARWIDFCDPAGHQKSDKSEFTSVEVINSLGVFPTSKPSNIQEKLEVVRQRLLMRNDGKVGIIIDISCTRIINGFKGGYRYAEEVDGKPVSELPLKDNYYDNCLLGDTLVTTSRGQMFLKDIEVGERVLTRGGYKKVLKSWMTDPDSEVYEVYFSNGTTITGTAGHPFWVKDRGWVTLDSLQYGDIMNTRETSTGRNINPNKSFSMDTAITGIQIQKRENSESITIELEDILCTPPSGRMRMEKFLRDIIYTIKMGILLITRLAILNVLKPLSTFLNILDNTSKKEIIFKSYRNIANVSDHSQKHGTLARKVENGISNMVRMYFKIVWMLKKPVNAVGSNTLQKMLKSQGTVGEIVSQKLEEGREWTMKHVNVLFVKAVFKLVNTQLLRLVDSKAVRVNSVKKLSKRKPVYNITVEDTPEYYANGILVHNCFDALEYMMTNFLELAPTPGHTNDMSSSNDIMGGGRSLNTNEYF